MEVYLDTLDAAIQAAVVDGTLIETTYKKKEEIVRVPAGQERQTDQFAAGYAI